MFLSTPLDLKTGNSRVIVVIWSFLMHLSKIKGNDEVFDTFNWEQCCNGKSHGSVL